MKARFCWFIFILVSFASSGQSESDSVFLFDFHFNYSPDSNARSVSRKTPNDDGTFSIETGSLENSKNFTRSILDKYEQFSEKKLQIQRSFWRKNKAQPGLYVLDVSVVNKIDSLYQLDLFSKELNIHQTVFSKTLIPICPIDKTIYYHPNCKVARIYYHESNLDSLWNSNGDLIEELFYFDDQVDSMPVIANNKGGSFDRELKRFIQQNINYPAVAREADIFGRLWVTFIITKSGKVEQLEVIFGGIHPIINNAAMDVLRKLEIEQPAMKDGEPVDLKFRHSFSFDIM